MKVETQQHLDKIHSTCMNFCLLEKKHTVLRVALMHTNY